MKELDELETALEEALVKRIASLGREMEAIQRELQAIRDAKASRWSKPHTRPDSRSKRPSMKAASEEARQSGALATTKDVRRAIASFRGQFESARVTEAMRKLFPSDKKLPKKIARELYDMRIAGELNAKEIQQTGSKRFTYENK
jgi:hypothetical protein